MDKEQKEVIKYLEDCLRRIEETVPGESRLIQAYIKVIDDLKNFEY